MTKPIFVVMGTTGEYSDRTEWPVCAYDDEDQAKLHVDAASEYARILKIARDDGSIEWEWGDNPPASPLDPDIQMITYSDGTMYYYMTVKQFDTVEAYAATNAVPAVE